MSIKRYMPDVYTVEDGLHSYSLTECAQGPVCKWEDIKEYRKEVLLEALERTDKIRKHMGQVYEDKVARGDSDMTSNSDWIRLEGAVSIQQELRRMLQE